MMASSYNSTGAGLTMLCLLPVLSTTASLVYATAELAFLSSWTSSHVLPQTLVSSTTTFELSSSERKIVLKYQAVDKVFPRWFETYFHRGVWVVVFFNTVPWTSLLLLVNLLGGGRATLNANARYWYTSGFVAVLGHLCFVP